MNLYFICVLGGMMIGFGAGILWEQWQWEYEPLDDEENPSFNDRRVK